MQKKNPVIKNYIMSTKKRILNEKTENKKEIYTAVLSSFFIIFNTDKIKTNLDN